MHKSAQLSTRMHSAPSPQALSGKCNALQHAHEKTGETNPIPQYSKRCNYKQMLMLSSHFREIGVVRPRRAHAQFRTKTHKNAQCAFAASLQPSAIDPQPGERRPIGVYRRSSAALCLSGMSQSDKGITHPIATPCNVSRTRACRVHRRPHLLSARPSSVLSSNQCPWIC
jgi:hypothetical protein